MIGKPHDGMRAMFTMMNNARLGVGGQGIGAAEGAYQKALSYAKERRQGRSMLKNGSGTIVDHADVRRMLLTMRSDIFAARAIALANAVAGISRRCSGDTPPPTVSGWAGPPPSADLRTPNSPPGSPPHSRPHPGPWTAAPPRRFRPPCGCTPWHLCCERCIKSGVVGRCEFFAR